METTHEIASVGGLYHNYAEDRSDEVLEMVVHVCNFLFITKKIEFQSFDS